MVNLAKAFNTPYGVYIFKRYKTDVNILKLIEFMSFRIETNRPFYSCLLSDLAFEWQRGWS